VTPEEEVVAAAHSRAHALAIGDAVRLRSLLHPDFVWTAHTGDTFDRSAYVARNTDGTTRWRSQDLGRPEVAVDGGTGVLRTVITDVVDSDDGPVTFRMPMTQVWTRTSSGWRCLGGHAGPRQLPQGSDVADLLVVTGLPGSGKSTLGRQLADALGWSFLDKDDVLEALFDSLGFPDPDARSRLSRAADDVLLTQLPMVRPAVLVNWWGDGSLARLRALGRHMVEVHCDCPVDVALARFEARSRHPGHQDDQVAPAERERPAAALRASWSGAHGLGGMISVDTSEAVDVTALLPRVRGAMVR
jgi:predicted kinase/ketosteroid isomerase-like protein